MKPEERDGPSNRVALAEAFANLPDPRVKARSRHDLVEMLLVTVCALVCGVDHFVGIELWATKLIEWLRRFL